MRIFCENEKIYSCDFRKQTHYAVCLCVHICENDRTLCLARGYQITHEVDDNAQKVH